MIVDSFRMISTQTLASHRWLFLHSIQEDDPCTGRLDKELDFVIPTRRLVKESIWNWQMTNMESFTRQY